jgi:signal transduction histidine kinase
VIVANGKVNDLGLTELYVAAARATINERCAPAFLHDIRGSLQALFGALELLGRSARAGGGDLARVEKACDLARRAINRHEKSTIDLLEVLTSQQSVAAAVEVGALTREVVHFLRNDAVNRTIHITVESSKDRTVWADRAKLQTLLAGLLTAAIDETRVGGELPITIDRVGDEVAVSIGSHAGYDEVHAVPDWSQRPYLRVQPKELTLLFAREFLAANGGRLTVDNGVQPQGSLTMYYPAHGSD